MNIGAPYLLPAMGVIGIAALGLAPLAIDLELLAGIQELGHRLGRSFAAGGRLHHVHVVEQADGEEGGGHAVVVLQCGVVGAAHAVEERSRQGTFARAVPLL